LAVAKSRLCRCRCSDRLDRVGRGGLGSARPVVIRAAEYKDHAQECRELAKRMLRPEDRDALERIAQIWERLETVSERHPDPELEPEHTERKTKGPGFESGPVESFAESVTRPYDVAARNFFILANAYRLQDISRSIPDLLLLITRGIIVECRPSSSRAYRCGGGSQPP